MALADLEQPLHHRHIRSPCLVQTTGSLLMLLLYSGSHDENNQMKNEMKIIEKNLLKLSQRLCVCLYCKLCCSVSAATAAVAAVIFRCVDLVWFSLDVSVFLCVLCEMKFEAYFQSVQQ